MFAPSETIATGVVIAEFNTSEPGCKLLVVVYMVSVPVAGDTTDAPAPFRLELTVQVNPDPAVITTGDADVSGHVIDQLPDRHRAGCAGEGEVRTRDGCAGEGRGRDNSRYPGRHGERRSRRCNRQ